MGLIKAALGSLNQVVGDQFKEFITCPAVANDVIVQRGTVQHGDANNTFTEGVISNGSGIAVPEGMAMMIVDNGKIVEFTAEPGTFTYDSSSEPSIFCGGLGNGIVESIKTIGSRITYGGQAAKDQRVYYVNIKLIPGLTYGSPAPAPLNDLKYGIINVTFNGMYSLKVADPAVLIANIVGANPKDSLTLDEIFTSTGNTSQLKQEFAMHMRQALNDLLGKGVSFKNLSMYSTDLTTLMNQLLTPTWRNNYGLEIGSVTVNVSATDDSLKYIQEIDKTETMANVYSNNMAGAMAAATASAMNAAASNDNGAMMGFMGMNMAQTQGASVLNTAMGVQGQAAQEAPVPPAPGQAFAAAVQTPEAPATEEAAPVVEETPVAEEAPVEETPAE